MQNSLCCTLHWVNIKREFSLEENVTLEDTYVICQTKTAEALFYSIILFLAEQSAFICLKRSVDSVPHFLHGNHSMVRSLHSQHRRGRTRRTIAMDKTVSIYIWVCEQCFKTDLPILSFYTSDIWASEPYNKRLEIVTYFPFIF